MKSKFMLYLVFGFLVIVIIIGLEQQFFGYDSLLNYDTFLFFILLSALSILIHLLDNPDFFRRIRSFEFGASGLKAQFDKAKDSVYRESQEVQSEALKEEIGQIRETPQSLLQQFIILYDTIEEKIHSLAQVNNITFTTGASTIGDLTNKNRIDSTTYMIFQSLYNIRNNIVHNPVAITTIQLENAFELGERLLSRLTYVFVQDIQEEDVETYIVTSERNNPKLKYFKGKSKTGKIGFAGMYYAVRVEE